MINSNFVSTGIDDFDKSINMLRLGDSIVCQVGTINDYKKFITPFINRARANNKIIVYFKFADKKPVFDNPLDNTKDSINNEPISDDLTNIKIPTLILYGVHDTICPYPFAEYMNRTIKNSVLTPLTDGGHGAFYECKDEINKSLEAFIYNYLQ